MRHFFTIMRGNTGWRPRHVLRQTSGPIRPMHVIDVQNRKDEGEGKKREAAKETHEPPPRMSPNLRPIVFGLKVRTRGFRSSFFVRTFSLLLPALGAPGGHAQLSRKSVACLPNSVWYWNRNPCPESG